NYDVAPITPRCRIPPAAQRDLRNHPPLRTEYSMFNGFETFDLDVGNGIVIHGRKGGDGPPLLLLHGHPQTHVIWHRVAEPLARHYTVIVPDLRGYGDSSKPAGLPDHSNYSKRAMALDQIAVMRHFGYDDFFLYAHDRGARVAHRLAMVDPGVVRKLMLLDIAKQLAMYEKTDRRLATMYF